MCIKNHFKLFSSLFPHKWERRVVYPLLCRKPSPGLPPALSHYHSTCVTPDFHVSSPRQAILQPRWVSHSLLGSNTVHLQTASEPTGEGRSPRRLSPASDGSPLLPSNPATHPRPHNPSSVSVSGLSSSQNSGKIVFQFIKGAVKDAGARSGEEMPRARPGRVLGTRAPVRAELGASPLAAWT